jgi:hypothetical protein
MVAPQINHVYREYNEKVGKHSKKDLFLQDAVFYEAETNEEGALPEKIQFLY